VPIVAKLAPGRSTADDTPPADAAALVIMRRTAVALLLVALCAGAVSAQDNLRTVEFYYAGRGVAVPQVGNRVEVVPILNLIGAGAEYSLAAGTYVVALGDRRLQFSPGHKMILVDGELLDTKDAPVPSPGGVAASIDYVDRSLLGPLGFRLEPMPNGYRIEAGSRFAEPVTVRPAAADFAATTTLVLALGRPVEATAETAEDDTIVVRFDDASPRLDPTAVLRSSRVRSVTSNGQELLVRTAPETGLLTWHNLTGPPRVIIELGRVYPTPTPAPSRIIEHRGRAPIVIDPGHGGKDTGAVGGNGLSESELTLAVARRLAAELQARGHAVRLTRDNGEGRALTDRTAIANRLEAEVFVSLHANASTFSSVAGAETYYMSLDDTASDEAAAATARLENEAGAEAEPRSDLDLILWDLAQASVLNESADLAVAVQTRLNELLGLRDRGVKQAPFVVLTGATMPAILVEVGFLSNTDEANRLARSDHQQALARAIATGLEAFLRDR
jgi:N-acetylmuramoyl-L-alanine amidase